MLHLHQTFTSAGRYLQSLKNLRKHKLIVCATCGCHDELTLHHVLPQFIGKFMNHAEFLKCMTVVLCRECHDDYERLADRVRLNWAEELGINLKLQKRFRNKDKELVKKYAQSILHTVDTMNQEKLFQRIDFILSYLSKDHYTYNDLIELSELDPMDDNPNYKELGVVMLERVGQDNLIHFWREHFLKFERERNNFIGVAA